MMRKVLTPKRRLTSKSRSRSRSGKATTRTTTVDVLRHEDKVSSSLIPMSPASPDPTPVEKDGPPVDVGVYDCVVVKEEEDVSASSKKGRNKKTKTKKKKSKKDKKKQKEVTDVVDQVQETIDNSEETDTADEKGDEDKKENAGAPPPEEEDMKQCLALECVNAARPGSKYCCEECAVLLQSARMAHFMPRVYQRWKEGPSVADQKAQEQFDELGGKITAVKLKIEVVEDHRQKLETHIEDVHGMEYDKDKAIGEDEPQDEEGDGSTFCVSCGSDVPNKGFIKHMRRCEQKFELQRILASPWPSTKPPNGIPIFCDVFNKREGTYCKKLYSVCPRHSQSKYRKPIESVVKKAKAAKPICGFPLVWDPENGDGVIYEFCRCLKSKCHQHYAWEDTQRGSIDIERLNLWTKLDELTVQQESMKRALRERDLLTVLQQQPALSTMMENFFRHHGPAEAEAPK